jgi:L-asparaginase II
MSPPPILARVWRGKSIESVHRGSVAVVDEDGRLVAAAGVPRGGIYLRSAAKPFQAMPLLEAGGEKVFRLGNDEIALLCASHGGEPRHVRVARRLLDRGGFSVEDLACGAHLPMHEPSARALLASGQRPTALHNNCSGVRANTRASFSRAGSTASSRLSIGRPTIRSSASSRDGSGISAVCRSPGSGSRWTDAVFPSFICRSRAWHSATPG